MWPPWQSSYLLRSCPRRYLLPKIKIIQETSECPTIKIDSSSVTFSRIAAAVQSTRCQIGKTEVKFNKRISSSHHVHSLLSSDSASPGLCKWIDIQVDTPAWMIGRASICLLKQVVLKRMASRRQEKIWSIYQVGVFKNSVCGVSDRLSRAQR